jgi:hypothetical protein
LIPERDGDRPCVALLAWMDERRTTVSRLVATLAEA